MLIRNIYYTPLYWLIIISCCLAGIGSGKDLAAKESPAANKVVARVNDTQILQQELMREVENDLQKYKKFGMKKASPALLQNLNQRALDRLIDTEVLSQAIEQTQLSDLETQAKKELESQRTGFPSPDSFKQFLQSMNMTEDAFLDSIIRKMRQNAYFEHQGIAHFVPPEEDVRSFYEKQKDSFHAEERVKVRHILIGVAEDADEPTKTAARKKAEDIRAKLIAGQDFAKLAKEFSDCQRSNNTGGDLDYIKHGFMPLEFDKVAFSIAPNTPSEVIATKFGYHIIEALKLEPAGPVPYEKARDYIVKYIEEKELSRIRVEHVKKLREKAKVEILLDSD